MNFVEIYTDGACKGNPGLGGWGVFIQFKGYQRALCGAQFDTTNNRMELMGAIEGLKALTQPAQIRLTTDSVYVRNGIERWMKKWQQNNWRKADGKAVLNQDLWQQLNIAIARHSAVSFHWVKGHSGHVENDIADRLANKAIALLQAKNIPTLRCDTGRQPKGYLYLEQLGEKNRA